MPPPPRVSTSVDLSSKFRRGASSARVSSSSPGQPVAPGETCLSQHVSSSDRRSGRGVIEGGKASGQRDIASVTAGIFQGKG